MSVNSKSIYLPGLNGLRAIAAIAVVMSHITLALGDVGLNDKIFGVDLEGKAKGLDLAGQGVTIFFTLSGFLITYLILKEKEVGRLAVGKFYVRRLLRIWPLYYLYFAICIGTLLYFHTPFIKSSVPFYIFFAANVPYITATFLPFLGHYWSLGVEEQFYLFFPHLAKYSNRFLFRSVAILIVLLLLLKVFFWYLSNKHGMPLPYTAITVTRFHIMLIGVLGSLLYYYNNSTFMKVATHKVTQILSWFCILLIAMNRFHVASLIDAELLAVISVCLIVGQISRKNRMINLENKICDFIGKISYGIYIIHPLLIFAFIKIFGRFSSTGLQSYLIMYGTILFATILLAYISYEYYEKRFLRLKKRFTIVKSSNTKESADREMVAGNTQGSTSVA